MFYPLQFADYSKDLPTYLQYCKDVVFAGLEPSFEDYEEEKLIDQLWDFYQNGKVLYAFFYPSYMPIDHISFEIPSN